MLLPQSASQQARAILAALVLTIVLSGTLLRFSLSGPGGIKAGLFSAPGPFPKTYIPYTFGYAALKQTLHGYDHVGWKDIVIVDNSWDGHAFEERLSLVSDFKSVIDVVRTPVHLRFSQLQGLIDHMARSEGAEAYTWSHTDMLLLATEISGPHERMQDCIAWARQEGRRGRSVAVMFLGLYDIVNVVFVGPSADAPWDPSMGQYGSDCDRYVRLRLAGHQVMDCPSSIGTIFHHVPVISHTEKEKLWSSGLTPRQQVELLQEIKNATGHTEYGWREGGLGGEDPDRQEAEENDRHGAWQTGDEAAAAAERAGGDLYFAEKWGENPECELVGRTPKFDVPRIA